MCFDQKYPPIPLLQFLPYLPHHFPLPTSCNLFLNSPSALSAISMCTGIGIPTRNRVVSWPTSLKEIGSLFPSSYHKPADPQLGVGHFEPHYIHVGILSGLFLLRSQTCHHSQCEFMCATALTGLASVVLL